MPGLISPQSECAKILYIGDSGHGKTGSKAALVAMGYKVRMVDSDNGAKVLRSLLTDAEHYPYASFMKKKGIDPLEPGRISVIPIDVPVGSRIARFSDGRAQFPIRSSPQPRRALGTRSWICSPRAG